ncbi:TonB-dependent receptor domain-containing protein [Achromobacter sp. DMS1]|uniref:TonB-dependent receptor domain-containing protein n=1 Tax=Achromobacter sp. DMS1 TaxID=1688405 RepID=UPI001F48387D|nr:TonB-dependent receptor [Achromobacter sp. DMS1]
MKDGNGMAGRRVGNVAQRNGGIYLAYRPAEGWHGEIGATFMGQRYADSANTVTLPGYARWDAAVGYRQARWDWTLAMRNLADKTYYASAASAGQIRPGDAAHRGGHRQVPLLNGQRPAFRPARHWRAGSGR